MVSGRGLVRGGDSEQALSDSARGLLLWKVQSFLIREEARWGAKERTTRFCSSS